MVIQLQGLEIVVGGSLLILIGILIGVVVMYIYYNYPFSTPDFLNQYTGNISVVEVTISERELEEILSDVESMNQKRLERFLANFLLSREIAVLRAMAMAFVEKGKPVYSYLNDKKKGLMNKHQIHLKSGESRKVIYHPSGLLKRLLTLHLILQDDTDDREKKATWGRRKERYRLNTDNEFVMAYAKAVLDSVVKQQ